MFESALRSDPGNADARWNLSSLLEREGDLAGAERETRAYIEKCGNPDGDGEARLAWLESKSSSAKSAEPAAAAARGGGRSKGSRASPGPHRWKQG